MYPRRFYGEDLKNGYIRNVKPHFFEAVKFTKEYIAFQRKTIKPISVGFFLSIFLTAIYPLHVSFCKSLNSLFSSNLIIFTALAAMLIHTLSPCSQKLKKFAGSIYEVAIQVAFFMLSGATAALLILNYKEKVMSFSDLLEFLAFMIIPLAIMLSIITTLPYFLLNYNFREKHNGSKSCEHKLSIFFVGILSIAMVIFYIFEPSGLPEHDFCESAPCEQKQN